jgi:hypothetical protein
MLDGNDLVFITTVIGIEAVEFKWVGTKSANMLGTAN